MILITKMREFFNKHPILNAFLPYIPFGLAFALLAALIVSK